MIVRICCIVAASAVLAGCSFQNTYERDAQSFTTAVINNDLRPVQSQIAPGIQITRVQVAQWSDELGAQGKLESLKETTTDCPPAAHCFIVKFARSTYKEEMRLDDKGRISAWRFHSITAPAVSKP
ncbi:MAG: hypothetical protein ACYDGM_00125 [Vulcanimicrobiaceae bacterium]